jgi:hypothetical protein
MREAGKEECQEHWARAFHEVAFLGRSDFARLPYADGFQKQPKRIAEFRLSNSDFGINRKSQI